MIDFKPTILIVDDMQVNLALLSEILRNDYNIKIAKNGQKALDIASNSVVDLILLDVVMPVMDGYEVCRLLKLDDKTKDIPVIFVTGNDSAEDEEKGFLIGAVDYILKPFKHTTVKSRVKTHINLHLRQIELETMTKAMQEKNDVLKRYTELIDKFVIISSTDLDGNIISASEAFCKISGYSKEELIGTSSNIVRHPDFPQSFYKNLWDTIIDNKTWEGEIKNKKKDGGFYWVKAFISPTFNDLGIKTGYTAIRQDITDKKLIEEISITDGLTNIYNRRHFNDIFPKIIQSSKRNNELVCFLLMDIDHFKQYNDNYGHQAGDDVLIKFAQCLKETLHRADDLAFRLGGEEFGAVFKAQSKEKAYEFANLIRENIENLKLKHDFNSASKYITASMGLICTNANDINNMDEVYKQADDLLYMAKENGRNQVKTN